MSAYLLREAVIRNLYLCNSFDVLTFMFRNQNIFECKMHEFLQASRFQTNSIVK